MSTLILATALFALTLPLVRWLVLHGGALSGADTPAISFCNVLFVGNLCAGILAVAMFGPRTIMREILMLNGRTRGLLAVLAFIAVAVPSFLFTALEQTEIINVILGSRIAPVLAVGMGVAISGVRLSAREWLGHALVVCGVGGLWFWRGDFSLLRGDGLVLLAALGMAGCSMLSQRAREGCSLGLLVSVRNGVSAVAFFGIAVSAYGFTHFATAFEGELWLAMGVYAFCIVLVAQLAWLRAERRVPAIWLARSSLGLPLLGVAFAFALLGEFPDSGQWVFGAAILLGMALSLEARPQPSSSDLERTLAAA